MLKSLVVLIALTFTAGVAQAGSTSEYTSLENCKVIASSETDADAEIDYFSEVCKGRDGLDVHFAGGDSRSWLSLIPAGVTPDTISYGVTMGADVGFFPNISGGKLEWRYKDGVLNALIVRVSGMHPETDQPTEVLAVVRVDAKDKTKGCVIASPNAKLKNANVKARQIADSSLTCPAE